MIELELDGMRNRRSDCFTVSHFLLKKTNFLFQSIDSGQNEVGPPVFGRLRLRRDVSVLLFFAFFFFLFFSLRLSLLFTSPRARRAPADTADKKANTQVAHQTDERTWDCHPLRDGAISFFFAAAAAAAAAAVGFLFFITEP